MAEFLSNTLNVYTGRDNKILLEIYYKPIDEDDYVIIPDNVINRAIFRFSRYCIDSNILTDPIQLIEDATIVQMQLGLISNLVAGKYRKAGVLTLFDNEHPNGIAWAYATLKVWPWPICGE